MFAYFVGTLIAFIVALIPGLFVGTFVGIVCSTKNSRFLASFFVALAFASLGSWLYRESGDRTEAYFIWIAVMFAVTMWATRFGNDLPPSPEVMELDRIGGTPAAHLKLAFIVIAALSVGVLLFARPLPYKFTAKSFEISDLRTPESNVDLVDLICPRGANLDYCKCLHKRIHETTSIFDRYLFTYGSGLISGYRVWQGGRDAGLSNQQITALSNKMDATVSSLKRQCLAELPVKIS